MYFKITGKDGFSLDLRKDPDLLQLDFYCQNFNAPKRLAIKIAVRSCLEANKQQVLKGFEEYFGVVSSLESWDSQVAAVRMKVIERLLESSS